jgi:hypothetical protein
MKIWKPLDEEKPKHRFFKKLDDDDDEDEEVEYVKPEKKSGHQSRQKLRNRL